MGSSKMDQICSSSQKRINRDAKTRLQSLVELTGDTPWDKKKPITTNTALLASYLLSKKQAADKQAEKVKRLAAEVEQLQAAIAEMSKLKTDKETKLENTMSQVRTELEKNLQLALETEALEKAKNEIEGDIEENKEAIEELKKWQTEIKKDKETICESLAAMNKETDDQHLVDTEARANQIVMLTTDKIKAQSENESIRIDLNNLKKTHELYLQETNQKLSEDSKQIEKLKVEVRRLQAETGSNSSTPTQSPRTPRNADTSNADGQPDQPQRLESVEEDNQL